MLLRGGGVALAFLFFGCSTQPVHNDRQGLFDVLATLEDGGGHRYGRGVRLTDSAKRSISKWRWPLEDVSVTSGFGRRGRRMHEGIDLKARTGTPVYAVGAGKVIYSGRRIRGYGRMIVIEHEGDFYSVYAHHSRNLVKKGQRVARGKKIALSGRSGRATGPHLHFEIRKGPKAIDPLRILGKAPDNRIADAR